MIKEEKILWSSVGIVLTALTLLAVWIHPMNEARTYNRLTGSHVTWWDALWVELRVMDCPR